ncbi:MAG TPA: HAD family hydrolase [Nitrospiria bacterium]|nr:HAD family hydrolase [Nitrospiria bacterium]
MFHFIVLDLDGTIEDSRVDMVASVQRVRSAFGLPLRNENNIVPWLSQGMDSLYINCFDDYVDSEHDEPRILEVQEAYLADYLGNVARETRLYEGMSRALDELSKIGKLAVATNKPEKITRRLLEELGVNGYFSAVVCADTVGELKPSPLLLKRASELTGYDASSGKSFMIGDSAGDIRMGKDFGAVTIWCSWGYAREPGIKPDRTAWKPIELPGIVKNFL